MIIGRVARETEVRTRTGEAVVEAVLAVESICAGVLAFGASQVAQPIVAHEIVRLTGEAHRK